MNATTAPTVERNIDGPARPFPGMLVGEMSPTTHMPSGSTVSPEAPSFEELLDLRAFGASRPSQSGLTPSEFIKTMDPQAREDAAAKFDALNL